MTNPFELHGAAFLGFYLLFGLVVIGFFLGWLWLTERGNRDIPVLQMTDPYLIAYLRGGKTEAVKVAGISLIDRGLLEVGNRTLRATGAEVDRVMRPIEKAILVACGSLKTAEEIMASVGIDEACAEYDAKLKQHGLLADDRAYLRRLFPAVAAASILAFVGVYKIQLALAQGRHNVGFLIMLLAIFECVCLAILARRRTRHGSVKLADLRTMFDRLRDRAASLRIGGATNEAALLAAVFGIAQLPDSFAAITKPFRPASSSNKGSSCSGCSSSCGSSCGGGGCGGGCGG